MTHVAKRKVSVTLDADLVAEIEAAGENLSAQVNAALRDELGRRRRHRALGALLDRMDAEEGLLDSPRDEAEIARYMRLLGGSESTAGGSDIAGDRFARLQAGLSQ